MSSSTFIGNPDATIAGPPPPPPPPPPVSGQLPAMRINTVGNAARRSQPVNNDAYEPPAAIQNAMLTKDKKPFTYTPGMGGKLDLSQIRSPRMARRVAKNANDEGIEGTPKPAAEPKPSQPPAASGVANFLMQPQVAVPVFPTNMPIQPHVNKPSQTSSINKPPSNVPADRQVEPSKNIIKVDTKAVPSTPTSNQSNTPESPSTPTQVTLAKAPTPWMQNKNKPQEEVPEWVKRASVNKTATSPSSEGSPATIYVQVQQPPPQYSQTKQQKQEQEQHLISQRPSQQSKPQQSLQQLQQQQRQNVDFAASQQTKPIAQSHQHEHVIPIRIEDRPSVFDAKSQSGHHQFKQSPTAHHQQRWGQVPSQHTLENQTQNRSQDQEHFQPYVAPLPRPEQPVGTYIIPLVVEGRDEKTIPSNSGNNTTGKVAVAQQQWNPGANQQHEPGPIQSKSFRVLQKITDTDASNDVGTEQIRRMELSEDERLLMNKFKEQVDQESYLHQEEDPRYRGAAIPSRAFRFLQNMTDSRDTSLTCAAPRNVQNVANKRQNRNSKTFEETQANLPPSEQQVQEPKKYMGSAIPSRSFRILQAMTAPESITTQENHQADYSCQTENYLPGNQQGIFLLSRPVPFWYPEGWSGCYPVHYNIPPNEANINRHSFPSYLQADGSAHNEYASFYPVYDNSFAENVARMKVMRLESFPSQCGYATVVYPQTNCNGVERSHVGANSCDYGDCRVSTADSSLAANDKHSVRNGSENETKGTVLPDEINHLDAQLNETRALRNVDGSRKNGIITAMNIVDKENGVLDSSNNAAVSSNVRMPEKTFGLRINIPNYTYVDTSDSSTCSNSSDSSDFGDSTSDNEDLSDSCRKKKCNRDNGGTTSNNTSSDDSDSDSYVAYSTNLNPYEKSKRELPRIASIGKNCVSNAAALECLVDNDEHSRNISKNGVQSEKVYSKENYFDYSADDRSPCLTFEQANTGVATKIHSDDGTDDRSDDFDSFPNRNQDATSSSNCELNNKCQEDPVTDNAVSYQPGMLSNDTERPDSESTYCESTRNIDEQNETFSDDSSDDAEPTMVSVSLPLKFKFFVSEDNEDITTVIIGNSRVNTEKASYGAKDGCDSARDNMVEDVEVNFHIGNDTSVDFTMKRDICDAISEKAVNIEPVIPQVEFTLKKDPVVRMSETQSRGRQNSMAFAVREAERDEMNSCAGPASKDVDDHTASRSQDVLPSNESRERQNSMAFAVREAERDEINSCAGPASKDVDDHTASRTQDVLPSNESRERQNSMAFAVREAERDEINSCAGPASKDVDDHTASRSQDVLPSNESRDNVRAEFTCNNFENIHSDKTIADDDEPTVATFECRETRSDFNSGPQVQIQLVDADEVRSEDYTIVNNDTELRCRAKLSVQDSRENTDDEDSGVTSDTSRIISEVDTDSECASSKHLKKYQRTQTHSRLFRLLNDDSVPSRADPSFRKKYLSLPLNTDAFNCDDSYCSSYSSGPTSPEYSPIHEQSLGKFYSTINGGIIGLPSIKVDHPAKIPSESIPPKEDSYFRLWKNPNSPDAHKHEVVPSLAYKILDSKMPSWAYKANVLCPRIKSTKNVPQTLSTLPKTNEIQNNTSPSTNLPIPTSCANSY